MFDEMKRQIERNSMKATVGRQMLCPQCKVVMDCRKAVELSLHKGDKLLQVQVCCTQCWDKGGAGVIRKAESLGGRIEVLDGRELFGRRKAKGKVS